MLTIASSVMNVALPNPHYQQQQPYRLFEDPSSNSRRIYESDDSDDDYDSNVGTEQQPKVTNSNHYYSSDSFQSRLLPNIDFATSNRRMMNNTASTMLATNTDCSNIRMESPVKSHSSYMKLGHVDRTLKIEASSSYANTSTESRDPIISRSESCTEHKMLPMFHMERCISNNTKACGGVQQVKDDLFHISCMDKASNVSVVTNGYSSTTILDKLSLPLTLLTSSSEILLDDSEHSLVTIEDDDDEDEVVETSIVSNTSNTIALDNSDKFSEHSNIIVSKMDELCQQATKIRSRKSVSFANEVQIRDYNIIGTDHPSCKDGLALSLDWDHSDTYSVSLDEVTSSTNRTSKYVAPTRLSYNQRRQRLQQVSPSNYKYWRDYVLLGGSNRSTSTTSLVSPSTKISSSPITTIPSTAVSESTPSQFPSGASRTVSSSPASSLSGTSAASTSTNIAEAISRLQQSWMNNNFLTLSDFSDSHDDDDDSDDDDDKYYAAMLKEESVEKVLVLDSSNETEERQPKNTVSNGAHLLDALSTPTKTSTVSNSKKGTAFTGRTSPTEQSVVSLDEDLPTTDWYGPRRIYRDSHPLNTQNILKVK